MHMQDNLILDKLTEREVNRKKRLMSHHKKAEKKRKDKKR